jgi:hypothetical protein
MSQEKSLVSLDVEKERSIWSLQKDQADTLIQSGALPSGIANMEQALAIIQYGRELGYAPMIALQNISLIKGRPSLAAHLIAARLKAAGIKIKVKEWTEKICTLGFNEDFEFSYTIEEATNAGLHGDNWTKYPKQMLYARAVSMGGRVYAPEVLMGVYSIEEMQDVEEQPARTIIEEEKKKLSEEEFEKYLKAPKEFREEHEKDYQFSEDQMTKLLDLQGHE